MKNVFYIALLVVVAGVGWWYYDAYYAHPDQAAVDEILAPVSGVAVEDNTTTATENDLEALDLGDIESELQGIDSELENL